MKGFKVVVTLPEGRKNHFVPGLSNNPSSAKAAADQICRLYRKQGLVISPVASFFDDERDLILPPKDHLSCLTHEQRCFCRWWKHGECSSCPDELTFNHNPKSGRAI